MRDGIEAMLRIILFTPLLTFFAVVCVLVALGTLFFLIWIGNLIVHLGG